MKRRLACLRSLRRELITSVLPLEQASEPRVYPRRLHADLGNALRFGFAHKERPRDFTVRFCVPDPVRTPCQKLSSLERRTTAWQEQIISPFPNASVPTQSGCMLDGHCTDANDGNDTFDLGDKVPPWSICITATSDVHRRGAGECKTCGTKYWEEGSRELAGAVPRDAYTVHNAYTQLRGCRSLRYLHAPSGFWRCEGLAQVFRRVQCVSHVRV
ncbi:uncharacterized protein B0H18DRAFT_1013159 [Fomitopsis serialis]|uniref:uncharacterized protein n=1 Tax=Fomitopsis serialis TaxID=139415 RepID=UPI002008A985|nr:uncharacterized protein B0H18DRAFT_1013159 [Neoantrodia serialis]KAH9924044.1 hypothetical protein B0H18DRAFT_1013159 [Neoantrodia serialis]